MSTIKLKCPCSMECMNIPLQFFCPLLFSFPVNSCECEFELSICLESGLLLIVHMHVPLDHLPCCIKQKSRTLEIWGNTDLHPHTNLALRGDSSLLLTLSLVFGRYCVELSGTLPSDISVMERETWDVNYQTPRQRLGCCRFVCYQL